LPAGRWFDPLGMLYPQRYFAYVLNCKATLRVVER
jgi:hypothetical protein